MVNLDKEKQELMEEIKLLGYESLRYSIFNDHRLGEWEVRIEFDHTSDCYFVYATVDRASYNKKLEFDNFEDAKIAFLERLEHFVKSNQFRVQIGKTPDYSSPLWDEK